MEIKISIKLITSMIMHFLFFQPAFGWDGAVTGRVLQIDVPEAEGYGFRVKLGGEPELCGNTRTWAYLNKSSSNYDTYVGVFLSAKMAKKAVSA